LESEELRDAFPMKATLDNIFDLLWKKEFWILAIFDKASVAKYNVEAFRLQLLAADIIGVRMRGGVVKWVIVQVRVNDNITNAKYRDESIWCGVHLKRDSNPRKNKLLT